MNSSRVLAVPAVLAVVGLVACGGGGTSSPTAVSTPPPAKAVIKVLIDPNPITAVATGSSSYPWDFRVNIQLSDSGGVGFIVTSMQTTVTSALTGAVLTTSDQNPFVGERIPAGGQSTKQYHVGAYRMEFGLRSGKFNIKLNMVDDRGNASVYDGSVNVQNSGEPTHLPQ
jgi:hypothetical protein